MKDEFERMIEKLKSEWNSLSEEPLKFSDNSRRSLFLKLREIESANNSFIPWELTVGYLPRFSIASSLSALLCFVTFQLFQGDLTNIAANEPLDSEYSQLLAGNEQIDEVDSNDLLIDEQQSEEI